jgi:hypothetical protein
MKCPRPESNQRTRFRKPLLYPLSYGGSTPERSAAAARLGSGAKADEPVSVSRMVGEFRVRLIDTAGGVIGIVAWGSETISEGDSVQLPDGRDVEVLEVYDDESAKKAASRRQSSWMTSRPGTR